MNQGYTIEFQVKALRKNGKPYWKKHLLEIAAGEEANAFIEIQEMISSGAKISNFEVLPVPSRRFTRGEAETLEFWGQIYDEKGKASFYRSLSKPEKLKAIHFEQTNNELWKSLDDRGRLRLLGRKLDK